MTMQHIFVRYLDLIIKCNSLKMQAISDNAPFHFAPQPNWAFNRQIVAGFATHNLPVNFNVGQTTYELSRVRK